MKTSISPKYILLPLVVLLLCWNTVALSAQTTHSIPVLGQHLAGTLDAQLAVRLGLAQGPAEGVPLVVTVPVDLENLEASSPVARLLAEEMTSWFVAQGYRVQEIRKGKNILMDPGLGETVLTRDAALLHSRYQNSAVLLVGTYTETMENIRFTIRLLNTITGEVLAMANNTLRLTPETLLLLGRAQQKYQQRVRPTVQTSYRPWRPLGRDVPISSWPQRAQRMSSGASSDLIDLTE